MRKQVARSEGGRIVHGYEDQGPHHARPHGTLERFGMAPEPDTRTILAALSGRLEEVAT